VAQSAALANNIVPTSGLSQQKLFVRDYKSFRVFEKNNTVLVINKMSSNTKSMVYAFGESTLSVTQTGNVTLFELMMPGKNQRHHLLYKHQPGQKLKVGYYSVNRKRYYSSVMSGASVGAGSEICSNKPMWLPSEVKQILGALTKDGSVQALDLDSNDLENIAVSDCTDQQSEVVKGSILKLLNNNAKDIFSCLQSHKNIDFLNKKENQYLLHDINMLIARVVRLLPENNLLAKEKNKEVQDKVNNKIKDEQGKISKFKISCKMEEAQKGQLACFDDSMKDPKISLNLLDPSFYDANKKLIPAQIEKNLKHELYHSSSQQMESSSTSCADEAVVKSIESLCAQAAPQPGSDIQKKCGLDKGVGTVMAATQPADGMTNASLKDDGRHLVVLQGNITQNAVNQGASNGAPIQAALTAQQTTTQFQQLAQAEIEKPSSTSVAKSTTGSGDRVEVSANSGFSNNYNQMTASLAKTANNMSATLSKVVAAAATTPAVAQASVNTVSTATTSVYSTAEIAQDKYAGLSATPTQLSGVDNRMSSTTTYNSRQVASANATADANVGSGATVNTVNSAGAGNAKPATADAEVATANTGNKISTGGGSGVSAMAAATSPSSAGATRTIATVSNSQSNGVMNSDNTILRQLTAFDKITGQTYNNIRKNYADPTFAQQLRDRGIQIYIESDKKSIGAADSGAKIKLKDDQQGLFKVKK